MEKIKILGIDRKYILILCKELKETVIGLGVCSPDIFREIAPDGGKWVLGASECGMPVISFSTQDGIEVIVTETDENMLICQVIKEDKIVELPCEDGFTITKSILTEVKKLR